MPVQFPHTQKVLALFGTYFGPVWSVNICYGQPLELAASELNHLIHVLGSSKKKK